jgi:hypothetical protein
MATLEKVTDNEMKSSFCLTDCGPSDGCNPDDDFIPEESNNKKKQ